MLQRIKTVNVLVRDYDEAVKFYTENLGFELHQNFPEKSWVILKVPKLEEPMIALCKADASSDDLVGRQLGPYGMFILVVDDCAAEYERMKGKGVTFTCEPQASPYGKYTLLKDLYGNNIFMSDSKFFG